MKKITLVLCACAIAFAGLFVSCSNDSGDVQLIYRDSTSYNYVYNLSGSKVVTRETATDKAALLTTVTETTSFEGLAVLTWSVNDDTTKDYKQYAVSNNVDKANKVTTTKYSGSAASSQTAVADVHVDNLRLTETEYWDDVNSTYVTVPASFVVPNFYITEHDEKFYYGALQNSGNSYVVYTDAEWKDYVDNGDETVAVSGSIEEGDSITITVTEAPKDNSTGSAVNKTTTVWTYKLTKAGADAE